MIVARKEPRDSQRSKVYKAERRMPEAMDGTMAPMPMKEIEAFVAKVVSSDRFKGMTRPAFHSLRVAVRDGRGTRHAKSIGFGTINLPLWARSKLIILHELAHTAVTRDLMSTPHAAHGWQFCSAYLQLVRTFMGVDAHDRLRQHFRDVGVRYKAPKQMSAETLASLRERGRALAAARRGAQS